MNKIDLTKTQIVDPPIEVEVSDDNFRHKYNAKLYNIDHRLYCPYRCVHDNNIRGISQNSFYKYARHIQTKIKVPDNIHIYFYEDDKCVILFNNDKQRFFVDNAGIYSVHKNTEITKQFAQLIPANKDILEIGCGYYFVRYGFKFKYIDALFHYGIYDGEYLIKISHGLPERLSVHDEKNIEVYKIIPDHGE